MNDMKFYIIDNSRLLCTNRIETFEYINNNWIERDNSEITDRLIGFDSSEPNDSPYVIGNTEIMESIKELTFSQAVDKYGNEVLDSIREVL